MTPQPYDKTFLRLLEFSPFERRRPTPGNPGGWRFGARRISDGVVARLIASGRATVVGTELHPVRQEQSR